jgi:hypothetical protein
MFLTPHMIGRHCTSHVSHTGWLTPYIFRPLTYFIIALTSPSFNRSAVLNACPSGPPMVHYVQRPYGCPLHLAVFNTLLEHPLQERRNRVILEFKASDVGWPSPHDVEEPLNLKFLFDWLLHLSLRVLQHLLNPHFISHFKGNVPKSLFP